MGQKTSPIGLRTGIRLGWQSTWFASKADYGNFLVEDQKIRQYIDKKFNRQMPRGAVAKVEITPLTLPCNFPGTIFCFAVPNEIFAVITPAIIINPIITKTIQARFPDKRLGYENIPININSIDVIVSIAETSLLNEYFLTKYVAINDPKIAPPITIL